VAVRPLIAFTHWNPSLPAPSRGSLLIVFLVVFIDLLGFGIVLPLLARYGEAYEASKGTLGLLMASFSAMQFIFAPIWGRLSDRIGRRPILMLGLAGSVIFYALFGLATTLGKDENYFGLGPLAWLFIARIGAGIAGATIPTAQAYIADVTDASNRGKGMALIGAAFGLGFTFGPLLASVFASADHNAAPSPYAGFLASGLSAVALLGAIFRLPESLHEGSRAGHREWLHVASLGRLRNSIVHACLIGAMFLATFAFAQFESTLSLLTELLGMAERQNFYVFAYLGFMLLLFQGLLVRRLMWRIGEQHMAVAGAALLAVGLALVAWAAEPARKEAAREAAVKAKSDAQMSQTSVDAPTAPSSSTPLWTLLGVLPIAVAGFSAINPALQSLLSLNTSAEAQGEILGVGQSASAIARILGPWLGITTFGKWVPAPYWSGAALMLLVAGLLATRKFHREPGPPVPVEVAHG
jgi:MFS transporter, DHA1 family, tetracycline resistance protein